MLDLSSFLTALSSSTTTNPTKKETVGDAYDREVLLCPSFVSESCRLTANNAKDIYVDKWTAGAQEIFVSQWAAVRRTTTADTTTTDGFASQEEVHEHNSMQSDNSSMVKQPRISERLSDPLDIPRELVFYRRKRDWDLPRRISISWHRETNIKHFYGMHKWMGQLCSTVGTNKSVIGTIVCYELQPVAAVRKSGHGAVLLRSVDASLYKLSLLAASSTLQSQTLWSEHWENLPLMLICNVYVPPPYRGLGLGLALVDDACRKPGRDIPWVLTATSNPVLQDYFGLLGFHPKIFGDSFGARWNDLNRGRLPKIDNLCPHFPSSSVVVSQEATTKEHPESREEDDLLVQEEVVLSNFQPTTVTSLSLSSRRGRRVW